MLNCRPNDLALIVRGKFIVGRVVRCIRIAHHDEIRAHLVKSPGTGSPRPGVYWLIDQPIPWFWGPVDDRRHFAALPFVLDANLKPLRDDPGQDETLTWKSLPDHHTQRGLISSLLDGL